MKTTLRQNKGSAAVKLFALVLAGFLLLAVFNTSAGRAVVSPLMPSAEIAFQKAREIKNWGNANISAFKSKKNIQKENLELKEKNSELEAKILICDVFRRENEELKSFFSRDNNKKSILSVVVSRPPQSPYDILIIDAGSDDGVKNGMAATAYSDVFIGYAVEVFPKTSKIKLLSFPSEETNVYIQSAGNETRISAIAIGKGGGNMEIKLPNSIEINSGDRITNTSVFPLLIGIVEKVEVNLLESYQTILFRLPVNIQELKYIIVQD